MKKAENFELKKFKKKLKSHIDSEKIKPLCMLHPQMIIYKRNFDENRRIYFSVIKEKFLLNLFMYLFLLNVFIKCMENLEKVKNIIKNKSNSKLIYSFYCITS